MLGDRRRRAVGRLECIATRPNRLRREVAGNRVLAGERDKRPVHGGVRTARLRRALPGGDLGSTRRPADIDDLDDAACYRS